MKEVEDHKAEGNHHEKVKEKAQNVLLLIDNFEISVVLGRLKINESLDFEVRVGQSRLDYRIRHVVKLWIVHFINRRLEL